MDEKYYKGFEPFFGAWKIERLIGEGSYGNVFEISRMYGSVTTEITESESYIGNWSNPGTSTNTATVTRALDGESVISGEDSSQGTEFQEVRDAMSW